MCTCIHAYSQLNACVHGQLKKPLYKQNSALSSFHCPAGKTGNANSCCAANNYSNPQNQNQNRLCWSSTCTHARNLTHLHKNGCNSYIKEQGQQFNIFFTWQMGQKSVHFYIFLKFICSLHISSYQITITTAIK